MRELRTTDPKAFYKLFKKPNDEKNLPPLDDLYIFFQNLNKGDTDKNEIKIDLDNIDSDSENVLNRRIEEGEVKTAIKQMKNGKTPGIDNVINEYIKTPADLMTPLYVNLFNIILDNGVFPNEWLIGVIKPIFKNKGNRLLPENYRPITLLCCISKLFTTILNNRLNKFIEENNILNEAQTAFRQGYSTSDHLFNIHSLIEILKKRKKKIFCAFIDFQKAFDLISRTYLWQKLLQNNINGNLKKIIYQMYQGIKSCICTKYVTTELFPCNIGVRQGENLSPVLFSLFLNDLDTYLTSHNCNGISLATDDIDTFYDMTLYFVCLLYADDTALVATNASDLQQSLNMFSQYCTKWKLKVNANKTKIIIFNGNGNDYKKLFTIGNHELENVKEYKYLGLTFTKLNKFNVTKKLLTQKATKAMYFVLSKSKDNNFSVECKLKLFDSMVLPILLYGCEIWGYENTDIIESIHIKFLRHILPVKRGTPLFMLYGELGRKPLKYIIQQRMISFWARMVSGKRTKSSFLLHQLMLHDSFLYEHNYKWMKHVEDIFNHLGMTDI
jgi:hypothetical protein